VCAPERFYAAFNYFGPGQIEFRGRCSPTFNAARELKVLQSPEQEFAAIELKSVCVMNELYAQGEKTEIFMFTKRKVTK
jgi:hypothetical protein